MDGDAGDEVCWEVEEVGGVLRGVAKEGDDGEEPRGGGEVLVGRLD